MKAVAKLRSGYTAVGTMARVISDPAIITMADTVGLDFIIFDMEHGAYSAERLLDVFAVSRPRRFSAFVRVPELSKGTISRLLDLGADGIMVPMCDSADDADTITIMTMHAAMSIQGWTGRVRRRGAAFHRSDRDNSLAS